MSKQLAIYPYNEYSKGGRALARSMGAVFLRMSRRLPINTSDPIDLINWGCGPSTFRQFAKHYAVGKVINNPEAVSMASNKARAFLLMKAAGVSVPEFTEDFDEAIEWSQNCLVLGRSFRGTCGKDICFSDDDLEEFANSNFWVKYKKKKDEFRIHVAFGKVIDSQRKALRTTDHEGNPIDTSRVDFRIRNLRNGFVFKRNDISVPQKVQDEALKAVAALGLDFGAVDVVWNETEQRPYVLEINTAPGLEGSTIESYTAAFRDAT